MDNGINHQMMNSFGLACPRCGHTDSIDIQALLWVRLTADGTDADLSHDGTHHWEPDSFYQCRHCAASGRVSELREEG